MQRRLTAGWRPAPRNWQICFASTFIKSSLRKFRFRVFFVLMDHRAGFSGLGKSTRTRGEIMARSTKHVPVAGSERAPVPGARAIRPTAASERVEVTVRVRPRSSSKKLPMPEQLGALLPRDRKYLSRKQLDATHAADPADLAKVKAFAKEHR